MIDYHKYVGYCRSDEKREKPMGGAGGRWDEEKPVENKPVENKLVENKPAESGWDYSTNSSIRVEIPELWPYHIWIDSLWGNLHLLPYNYHIQNFLSYGLTIPGLMRFLSL